MLTLCALDAPRSSVFVQLLVVACVLLKPWQNFDAGPAFWIKAASRLHRAAPFGKTRFLPTPKTSHATGIRRQLHDRQPLRHPSRPRLASLHEDHPPLRPHVVQRDKNILDYASRGARDVIKIQTAYEPTLHFPPPAAGPTPTATASLLHRHALRRPRPDPQPPLARVRLRRRRLRQHQLLGPRLQPDAFKAIFRHGELYRDDYRNAIWRSRINLSFLTHSNQDEFVHKSFEIAGCGGFLLAERSAGHLQRFKEDEEAVFFSTLRRTRRKDPPLPPRRGRQRSTSPRRQPPRRSRRLPQRPAGLIIAINRLSGSVKSIVSESADVEAPDCSFRPYIFRKFSISFFPFVVSTLSG